MGRPPSPRVIAHRGASRDRPENTIAAFDEALRQGCDGIELDVQLSRDEVPVVYHDKTLTRAGGGRRRVHQLDVRDLKALDAGARVDSRFRGQHIPTLEEVLDRYARETRLLVEIKTREGARGRERHLRLARMVAAMIRRSRPGRRAMILSFDDEILETCREVAPSVGRVLNVRPSRSLTDPLRRKLPDLEALSADVRTLTPAFGAAVAREGLPLLVFTCNTPRGAERALDAHAAGLMSDRPGWLKGYLGRRAGHDAT